MVYTVDQTKKDGEWNVVLVVWSSAEIPFSDSDVFSQVVFHLSTGAPK